MILNDPQWSSMEFNVIAFHELSKWRANTETSFVPKCFCWVGPEKRKLPCQARQSMTKSSKLLSVNPESLAHVSQFLYRHICSSVTNGSDRKCLDTCILIMDGRARVWRCVQKSIANCKLPQVNTCMLLQTRTWTKYLWHLLHISEVLSAPQSLILGIW